MTIFHPTDFSDSSHTAFRHALRIAFELKMGLTIMHVGDGDHHDSWSAFPHIRETLAGWNLIDADISREDLEKLVGLRVAKIEATGSNPVDVMTHYLDEHDVNMIVMATQGRSGMAAVTHPSVARALARKVKRPFLFVRDGVPGFIMPDGHLKLDHVLVPVDDKPDPQLAIDAVVRLTKSWEGTVGTLEALHVGEGMMRSTLFVPELEGTVLKSTARTGDPEEVIPAVASDHKTDLIVMVYAGPDRLAEKLTGSTTEQVMRAAPCPVLALPEPGYG
ncbi:MAG: universal stress protein [Pseudomonadota bacterium]